MNLYKFVQLSLCLKLECRMWTLVWIISCNESNYFNQWNSWGFVCLCVCVCVCVCTCVSLSCVKQIPLGQQMHPYPSTYVCVCVCLSVCEQDKNKNVNGLYGTTFERSPLEYLPQV